MADKKVRITLEFSIDEEALNEHGVTAEEVFKSIYMRESDGIDGFEINTNVPGFPADWNFFLCDGHMLSKELVPEMGHTIFTSEEPVPAISEDLLDEDFLNQQVIEMRDTVGEQVNQLLDGGYLDENLEVYVFSHLDEITKAYLVRCEKWDHLHEGEDMPISEELDIMHQEILKMGDRAKEELGQDVPLHETALYREALGHFDKMEWPDGTNSIENDYVRAHAAELISCYERDKTLLDFDFWTHYETLTGETLTWGEYSLLDELYGEDPPGDRCFRH